MPVISRGVPSYSNDDCNGSYPASQANDANYNTHWSTCNTPSAASPQWLAYDLSSVPAAHRGQVIVAWYNDPITSEFDHTVDGGPGYDNVGAYTIQTNAAPGGGAAPTTGWVTVATVTGNKYSSRQHLINMAGSNWVRLDATASDGSSGNTGLAINMDVHDASSGVTDDWIFYGDSITQDGLAHDSRTAPTAPPSGRSAKRSTPSSRRTSRPIRTAASGACSRPTAPPTSTPGYRCSRASM